MAELLRDPELDRLVREMNEGPTLSGPPARAEFAPLDSPQLRKVTDEEPLEKVLAEMARHSASDLLLVSGAPPSLRIDGRLVRLEGPDLDGDEIRAMFASHLGSRSRDQLAREGSTDFPLALVAAGDAAVARGWRLRVNLHRQRGELAAAVRALPQVIPSLHDLNLPPSIADLMLPARGLVLVCGPTGAGKSSTLAAIVGLINASQACHVITIEDPIEFEHPNQSSIIEQVEIGSDAPSFAAALRAGLRRDPDVILVGEMRDLETMAIALSAAETGHLVLATLHVNDVAQAVHRVVDVFPANQQEQIRQQLSQCLHAIICQQLVPRCDTKGRLPAIEMLVANYAVRNHIRKGTLHHLYNELLVGRGQGMISLEESLGQLIRQGKISADEARSRTTRLDELERVLAPPGAS